MSAPPGCTPVPCRACGKGIAFVQGSNGKAIPLDVVAPAYRVVTGPDGTLRAERAEDAYVSHFATCTDPQRFSKGKR